MSESKVNGLPGAQGVPRIERLEVRNYRALKDLKLNELSPLSVFLGPNGSGKSTLFDVFAFLAECFSVGLRKAWERRGRFRELRTRGEDGAIEIGIEYREASTASLLSYRLAIAEEEKGPYVAQESLEYLEPSDGPMVVIAYEQGEGVAAIDEPSSGGKLQFSREKLDSPEFLAVNALGQLASHPRVSALRRFITDWHLSYLTSSDARSVPEAGAQERLSSTGDNLANVIQYLSEQHPERLEQIFATLRRRVPSLERVEAAPLADGRLLLQVKDAPFERPILAKYVSDGTLKLLAYLILLYDPDPPQLIGIEEPENYLHPRLLADLAEECRIASGRSQLMVTTHSPYFVDGLYPEELWVVYRDENGFTQARSAKDMQGIPEFMAEGGKLGDLWMEGYFDVGDPLKRSGGPRRG